MLPVSNEHIGQLLEGTARALTGDSNMLLSFPGCKSSRDGQRPQLPLSDEVVQSGKVGALRGCYDAIAMRARFHDAEVHYLNAPPGPLSRALYDALENVRIEVCAARVWQGVAANLAAVFEQRFNERGVNVIDSDKATPMANAVVLMLRTRLLDSPLAATRYVSRWQDEINTRAGENVEALCAVTADQVEFSHCARRLVGSLELVDLPEQGSQPKEAEMSPGDSEAETGFEPDSSVNGQSNNSEEQGGFGATATQSDERPEDAESVSGDSSDHRPDPGDAATTIPFPLNTDNEPIAPLDDTTQANPEEPGGKGRSAADTITYHAYTTRFDEVVNARGLLTKDQLQQYRAKLDQEISSHRRVAVRLAKRLQNSLRTLQKRTWTFDLDDGLLDTTCLSRLVIDPSSPLAYKQERDSETRDTVVSFLIDNSGSMRGQPIALAAMFTDILAQALERCHVATEILGFTTAGWRGGQTRESWSANGKPGSPGRLSDLRHIIYKLADEPWRKARQSLGVMLWPALLKENIDGEALLWAHRRLAGRREQRRILVVISDGVPADDATLTANGRAYLETHLRQVVDWIEKKSDVELLAIGIGHDVQNIYRRSVTITDTEQLGDAMAYELIELLGNVPRTVRHPYELTQAAGQTA